MPRRFHLFSCAALTVLFIGGSASAAPALPGDAMGPIWIIPFAGVLLSIAAGPLLIPKLWHSHYGKIAGGWAAAACLALLVAFGFETALAALVHALLAEYLSFIVLLFTLYTVAGGVLVTANLRGTPLTNAALLAIGACVASFVGTTGAAMILIRPLLRANERRPRNAHVVVFFIILVANVGGALTPLGDPPLFVGFLRGVDFFWTMQHLWLQTAITGAIVLALSVGVDTWFYRREGGSGKEGPHEPLRLAMRGRVNLVLILAVAVVIVASGAWQSGEAVEIRGTVLPVSGLIRDAALLLIAVTSLLLTPNEHRRENGFTWEPIREVAILFAAIFVAIIPVLAVLQAGSGGAFAPLLELVTDSSGRPREVAYFWLTGGLSAFLDNAPTYLVFFELAGGDAEELMGPLAGTLAAISMGAVYMGALTYLGNAPNLMVYAIAVERGVRMPSFLAYLFWASLILLPIFVLLTLLPIVPVIGPS